MKEMGQPIVAITLNYRLSAWGFLQGYDDGSNSSSLSESGSNWGLRDQRLALHWIQENINAFGGQYHNLAAVSL
jgi:carboxylesterase type B